MNMNGRIQHTCQCSTPPTPRLSDPKCRSWDSLLIRSYWFHLCQPPSAAANQPAQRSDREAGFTQALCLQRVRDRDAIKSLGLLLHFSFSQWLRFPLVLGRKPLFVLHFDKDIFAWAHHRFDSCFVVCDPIVEMTNKNLVGTQTCPRNKNNFSKADEKQKQLVTLVLKLILTFECCD